MGRPTGLVYAPDDLSAGAVAWREDPLVQWATQHWQREVSGNYSCAFRHRNPHLLVDPFDANSSVSVADVARLFELALGPMGLPPRVEAAVGVDWFGVDTQQSVVDSQTIHSILWRLKVDLVIEIGTMCGGSAIFYAKTMMGYNSRARVATFDVLPEKDRIKLCTSFSRKRRYAPGGHTLSMPGLNHTFWTSLKEIGNIVPFRGSANRFRRELEEMVRNASMVSIPFYDELSQKPPFRT